MVIFMSCRGDSLIGEIFGFPKRVTSLYHRAMSETLLLFLGAIYQTARVPGVPAISE